MPANTSIILEEGKIFFIYRPRIGRREVQKLADVQRLFIVLSPNECKFRLLVVGRKKLPDIDLKERFWGFIDEVRSGAEDIAAELSSFSYQTKTLGERHQEQSRPVAEGKYSIVLHGKHTHLVYKLELPEQIQQAQREFNIEKEGSYIFAIKNPQERGFRPWRFGACNPAGLMDIEGAQFVLIGADHDVSAELGVEPETQVKTEDTAEAFRDLHIPKSPDTSSPLRGELR